MSDYHVPRGRNRYKPGEPFNLSRSKVDDFVKCPRCFYIDRVHGIGHPPSLPLNLNKAVDLLLKKEFDHYRQLRQPHPLMAREIPGLVPMEHPDLETWRANFQGIRAAYGGLTFSGAVDDIWTDEAGRLVIVDYKSTASMDPVTALNDTYHNGYKRQIEFYQWLFRKNGFQVNDLACFVYCTGDMNAERFDGMIRFDSHLIRHTGNTDWVEPLLDRIITCLNGGQTPEPSPECNHCKYSAALQGIR